MSPPLHLRITRTWEGRPIPAREQVSFRLSADAGDLLIEVDAPFHDDPPPPGPPGPTDQLWNHEVAELLIVDEKSLNGRAEPTYTELELSPHGHYLLLRLRGVRTVIENRIPISYRARIDGDRWSGQARLPDRLLPPAPHLVNAYAISGAGNERRYLAMTPVPGAEPDFHRLDAFEPLILP